MCPLGYSCQGLLKYLRRPAKCQAGDCKYFYVAIIPGLYRKMMHVMYITYILWYVPKSKKKLCSVYIMYSTAANKIIL